MNISAGSCPFASLVLRPGHIQQPVGVSAGILQAKKTNWVEIQPYSPAGRLPKDFLSLQSSLELP